MQQAKQRYYAAIEQVENAERMLERQREEEMMLTELRGEEQLYADLGVRAYRAFANLLDSLGDMTGRPARGRVTRVVREAPCRRA